MLHNIRKFSKTFLAKIVLVIMIIPFVLWGMGGVFNSGNTNNVAKINNKSISTQDFMNFLNNSNIDTETVRENLENNVLEQLVSTLISEKLLEMEIKDLNLKISEKSLAKNIRKNPNFFDENNKFSRTKYEKFLLSSNLSAANFEMRLKNNELQKKLFYYIGGGLKTPFFFTNNVFKNEKNKINLEYINLNNAYIKKNSFTNQDIEKFIKENSDDLKEEFINFSYLKITPENLIGSNEYSQDFFGIIDEIENDILNGKNIEDIALNFNLNIINKKNYNKNDKNDPIEEKIYDLRENKIELFDEGNFYVLYQINDSEKILPDVTDEKFKERITEILYQKNKYELNRKILGEIDKRSFSQKNFEDLSSKNSIKKEKLQLKSIDDNNLFTKDSVKLIYSLPQNSFTLVSDENDNIYLVKISDIVDENILKGSEDFGIFEKKGKLLLREQMYSSYDIFLENKYEVKINQKTLERVKNYFK